MGVGAGRINEEMNENDNLLLSYKNRHKLRKDLDFRKSIKTQILVWVSYLKLCIRNTFKDQKIAETLKCD